MSLRKSKNKKKLLERNKTKQKTKGKNKERKHDVEIRSTGKNLYVFQFHHWRDKQRVVEGQPWHFDRHVLLLNDIMGNCKPSDIPLFEFPIWARVYNLPFKGRLNSLNMQAIGDKIGTFVRMDQSGAMGIDKSVRIRIKHDVRKPLVSCIRVKMKNGMEEEFDVKYERPPLFCFQCGKVGHGTKDCDEEEGEYAQEIKFGGWLKASPWKVGGDRERDGAQEGVRKCAKALFITKPKRDEEGPLKEKVNAVMESLVNCGLSDRQDSQQMVFRTETENTQVEGMSKNDDSMIARENQISRDKEKGVEKFSHHNSDDKPKGGKVERKKVKVWRNKTGREREDNMVFSHLVGHKRNGRELNALGLDEGEMEEMRILKKVGVDSAVVLEGEECKADENVAGPTEWALCDQ